jgi:putative chitobiose transport system substrate-binding protein
LLTSGGNALKAIQQLKGTPLKDETSFNAAIETVLHPMKPLLANNLAPREAITGNYSDALTLYMSGHLHTLEAGTSALKQISLNAPAVYASTRISEHPHPDSLQGSSSAPLLSKRRGDKLDASPMVLVVPKKSPHPQEALAFARYITSTKNQLTLSKEAPVLPSTIEGLNMLMAQRKSAQTLDEKALYMSARKVLSADKGLATYPNQATLNDLSNAMAQAYYLEDTDRFNDYRQRLWKALPKP